MLAYILIKIVIDSPSVGLDSKILTFKEILRLTAPKVPTDEWCDTTADAMKILLLATKNASFRKANAKIGHFYEIG